MTSDPPPFLLAAALADADPRPALSRRHAHARAAEDAGLDFVTIEDGPADALLVAASVAATTTRIGVIAAAATTTTEPFHVSTGVATLDGVGAGRGGWLAEVVPAKGARGAVTWAVPDDVLADAAEHIDAVRALWDSWEEGAEIRDAATARFVDGDRVHHVDLGGEHLAVRGPSITPRPPQGNPPIFLRARSDDDLRLTRDHADGVLLADPVPPAAVGQLVRIRELRADDGDLAAAVADAQAAGYDGALVHATNLTAALAALRPMLTARSPAEGTLRARLGLGPASNRFAAA